MSTSTQIAALEFAYQMAELTQHRPTMIILDIFHGFWVHFLVSRTTKSLTGEIMSTLAGIRNGSRVVTALGTIRDI